MRQKILAIVGPSCAGKDTVKDRLALVDSHMFHIPQRVTSRPRRPGERDSSYRFVTKQTFKVEIKYGCLAEYGWFRGWGYGTRIDDLTNDDNKINVLTMDLNSLKMLKRNLGVADIRCVYLDAPLSVRLKRYKDRNGGESSFEMYRRAISDSFMYRNAIDEILKLGIPHTYIPNDKGLYGRTDDVLSFCKDWLNGQKF